MKKSTKPLLYFAYGSNLNKFDWNHHGVRPPFDDCFEKVSNAWLSDYVPAFTYDSPVRSGGVLDVVARPGCCTPGVVFRLKSRKGLDALRQKEGSPYSIIAATVVTSDNRLMDVFTFTIKPRYVLGNYVTPSEEYVTVVRKGLRYHKLSTNVLDAVVARTHIPYMAKSQRLRDSFGETF